MEVNEVMINERNDAMREINRDLHNVRVPFSFFLVLPPTVDSPCSLTRYGLLPGLTLFFYFISVDIFFDIFFFTYRYVKYLRI